MIALILFGAVALVLWTIQSQAYLIGADGTSDPSSTATTWSLGVNYSALTVERGANILFQWTDSFHGVATFTNDTEFDSCESVGEQIINVTASTSGFFLFNTSLAENGSEYYFYCPVDGHCSLGMKVEILVLVSNETDHETGGY